MKYFFVLFVAVLPGIIFSFGCKKKGSVAPQPAGSQYTSLMGGVRIWHGTNSYSGRNPYSYSNSPSDTAWNIALTETFAINMLSNTSISFDNIAVSLPDTISFNSYDSVAKTITFSGGNDCCYGSMVIVYNYAANSISYNEWLHEGAGSDLYYNLSTP